MFKFQLLENEKVVKVYRQTEAVLFKPALIVMALIYFPWYFLLKYDLAATHDRLLLIWTLLVFFYGLNKYLIWLLNVDIITDKRLVCVNYLNLLNKKVTETPLTQILNASFSMHGFWQSIFRFGSVEIRAAGLAEPMILKNLPHPATVKDFIWKISQGGK